MGRARPGAARNRKRKRMMRAARGYFGANSRHPQRARETLMRAGQYAYRDRRQRRRNFRSLWITRITAACRMRGTRYSHFMSGLRMSGIILNRKMLSQLAIEDPKVFDRLVESTAGASRAQAKVAAKA